MQRADIQVIQRRYREKRSLKRSAEILMATSRRIRGSVARYTSPMPPAPMGSRISYGPSLVPAESGIYERFKLVYQPELHARDALAIAAVAASMLTVAMAQHHTDYPAHWWTPVSTEGAPAWEILPQTAKPGEVILSKRNELGILSNFAATPFTLRGKRYASVEGFWQMMLYPEGPGDPRAKAAGVVWLHTRDEVAAMTAFEAKDAGTAAEENMRKMGIDWVTFEGKRLPYRSKKKGAHYRLILEAMRAKLEQNFSVQQTLLSTGDLILRPDHVEEPDSPAEWLYFRIWMDFRSKLQSKGKV